MIKAFLEPSRIDEALRLKRELGDAAIFLAGGTEVNASHASEPPENVISLGRLELGRMEKAGSGWSIPASSTIQEILDTAGMPEALVRACRNIVNRNVRNMATIGGHVASNKSCADVIPALVALQATVETCAVGDGSVATSPIIDLISKERPPALIRRVLVPLGKARGLAIENYTRSSNDLSVLNVAVSVDAGGGAVGGPIVAVGGVAAHVVRLPGLEAAIDGKALPVAKELEGLVQKEVSPISDLRGSAGLKRHLAGVLVARALCRAVKGGDAR